MGILPINKEPYARAYNSTGFPLSIIFAQDDYLLPFFLNTHIQINRDLNKRQYAIYNFHHVPLYYYNWECFETQIFRKYIFINQMSKIRDFIEKNIDLGYYMISYVDEFYIDCRRFKGVKHFMHDSLLYGYDECFYYILGYNDLGHYDTVPIEKDKFVLALFSDNDLKNINYYDVSQFIYLIKIKPGFNEDISIKNINLLLRDYVYSINTAERLGVNVKFHENYVFGIHAFENLAREIIEDNYIDFRFIRLFYEHKYIMLLRFKYLEKILDENDLSSKYLEIEKHAKNIYNLALKYGITKDQNLLKKVSDNILDLISQEESILLDVMELI